ncbi:beta-lactamase family protein [Nonomuraea sp. 3-1Str]|uniref:serine hydrolase domain-containing protein n=1 Tax=Nonomuraea sp. 3-1Str TaxID=2929801 RepID=UPI00285489C8|nr:serine hydrolase domain-containing protein [Nonomuraea sp. 3-1Str]MDR8408759.1 beta-lactamase family protein [Nonomuraea sp. 3-1Str]
MMQMMMNVLVATAVTAGGHGVDVRSDLEKIVAGGGATAALARVSDGGHTWSGAVGVRDIEREGRPSPNGYFRIGSVTKTFVATVVLQLVDEGRIQLDDPVDRYLPGLVPGGAQITVRRLLNHTSHLYDYMSEPGYSTNRWRGDARFRSYQPRELLEVAFAKKLPDDGKWHYSNTNYVVLGLLVEKLTGHPYGKEVTRRILRPLGLRHTVVPGDRAGLPAPHAKGYEPLPGLVDATRMNPSLDWAAGEMISTAADLERFMSALLDGKLISKTSLQAMRTTVETGAGFGYGLGLQAYRLPCGTVWGHSGELIGYLTFAFRSDSGKSMTLSINPSTRNPSTEEVMGIAVKVFCGSAVQRRD